MAITVTGRCGHDYVFTERQGLGCPQCGETGVSDVRASAPRFVGTVSGPHAETQALPAMAVDLAPGGPLPMPKESSHGG